MRKLLSLLVLPLVGCAAQAPRVTANDDPSVPCLNSLAGGEFSPLTRTDAAKPTADEQSIISGWVAARQRCLALGADFRQRHAPPGYRTAFDAGQSELFSLATRLYAGQITYGEFSMKRAEIGAAAQARFAEVAQQEQQAATTQQAAADDRSRAASAAYFQGLAQAQARPPQPVYQIVQPAPRVPTTTNCQRWGNQLSCTSY